MALAFVFDEPSSGLHATQLPLMIEHLHAIKNEGNTVIVIDHNPQLFVGAEHAIELGPGSGQSGGSIVYSGKPKNQITQTKTVATPPQAENTGKVTITNCSVHNLRSISVSITTGSLIGVCGGVWIGKVEFNSENSRAGA